MPYKIAEPRKIAPNRLDLEAVLAATKREPPCGPDLEYDPEFMATERALRSADEGRGDIAANADTHWSDVRRRCESLLARSKDLRTAVAYLRALTRTEQLPGFAFGLRVIAGLTTRYWEHLHPALDAGEGSEASSRLNALAGLAPPLGAWSHDSVLCDLRSALVVPETDRGRLTVRDVVTARGATSVAGASADDPLWSIDTALPAAGEQWDECTRAWLSAPHDALAALDALQARLDAMSAPSPVPDLLPMRAMLQAVAKAFDAVADYRTAHGAQASQVVRPGVVTLPSSAGPCVRSREDARRAIDAICAYLDTVEPTNAASLLLRRAQRLLNMSFLEAVADLAPGGLEQLRGVAGVGEAR